VVNHEERAVRRSFVFASVKVASVQVAGQQGTAAEGWRHVAACVSGLFILELVERCVHVLVCVCVCVCVWMLLHGMNVISSNYICKNSGGGSIYFDHAKECQCA
jgi:hypothetical protein